MQSYTLKPGNWMRTTLVVLAVLSLCSMALFGCSGNEANRQEGPEHAEHQEQDGHEEEQLVRLGEEELREFEVELREAGPAELSVEVSLPGEVVVNPDRLAHMVPQVPGLVKDVRKTIGDTVAKGELLAVISSREFAEAKSEYLASRNRASLAWPNYQREKGLWEKKITSEQEYLEARNAWEESRIERKAAEQKLHALGLSHQDLKQLHSQPDTTLTHYEITAPFAGTVINRHITLGEIVNDGQAIFTIADLSTVWVNITVYQRDLVYVKAGQDVEIEFGHGIPDAHGRIDFVSPVVDEATRTAFARVVLENPDRVWRPGIFVTGIIETGQDTAEVVVPRSAIIGLNGKQAVFVETDAGLVPHEVQTGRMTENRAEIVSGLRPGERFAFGNVLALKAELNRGALEHAGHAH